ncbi:MAG: 30S ribosomal protein S16 [Planctomycetota bacterium]
MAVKLRLKRFGRLNHPTYRVCAAEGYFARNGRVIETLGYYLPKAKRKEEQFSLNAERVGYWLSVGACPSETVTSLIKQSGIEMPKSSPRKRGKSKTQAKPFVPPKSLGKGRKAKAKWRAKHAPAAAATETAAPESSGSESSGSESSGSKD